MSMSPLNDASADLFCSPLDPSGLYTISFPTDAIRDAKFDSDSSRVNLGNAFVYIRKDEVLKVQYNADYLDTLGINYCRYKESGSVTGNNSKYIYAFVDRIEYLASNVSALHIRTDSFMTYQNNISTSTQEFILRRTVDGTEDTKVGTNDTSKNTFQPEPVNGTNYRTSLERSFAYNITGGDFFNNFYVGVLAEPFRQFYEGSWLQDRIDPNADVKAQLNAWCCHVMNGFPTGANIFVTGIGGLTDLANALGILGSNILGTFWVPVDSGENPNPSTKTSTKVLYYQDVEDKKTFSFTFMTIDSISRKAIDFANDSTPINEGFEVYEPINNKCYNYPYQFLVLSDNAGAEIPLRFEDFADRDALFYCYFVTNPENALLMIPKNYAASGEFSLNHTLIVEGFPQIPYMSDNYAYYQGTHGAQIAVNRYSRYMEYAAGAVSLIKNVVEAEKSSTLFSKSWGDIFSKPLGKITSGIDEAVKDYAVEGDRRADALSVSNAASCSTRATLGYLGVFVYKKYLATCDIRRIDEFFSRYGYAWNLLETFNYNHCPDYDYIQTQGCNIEGQIPAADKAKINALFDAGITIWHERDGSNRYGLFADSDHTNKNFT